MKIGLYIQDYGKNMSIEEFNKFASLVKKESIDLFVFPEDAKTPFDKEYDNIIDWDVLKKKIFEYKQII